eukprot:GHVL01007342.1.p1 GENE.GHVL01007342.1~~GHVL01007342.1.p1  ORF type:complete len:123 (+),score=17.97 GHVL01007342.1:162-530(+)
MTQPGVVPSSTSKLRACFSCGLIKTRLQFYEEGCNNCDFFPMTQSSKLVDDCTTPNFEGMVAVMDLKRSWVARRIGASQANVKAGVYCVRVFGEMEEHIRDMIPSSGSARHNDLYGDDEDEY